MKELFDRLGLLLLLLFHQQQVAALAGEDSSYQDDKKSWRTAHILKNQSESGFSAAVVARYNRLYVEGVSVTAISAGGEFSLLASDSIAMGVSLEQAFSQGNATESLFTAFKGSAVVALTGALRRKREQNFLEATRVLDTETSYRGGLRLHLLFAQYLVNTATSVVPYSGPGVALQYALPSKSDVAYGLGIQFERLSNQSSKILTTSFAVTAAVLR